MSCPYDTEAVALLLGDDAAFATVLHAICLATYGDDIYQVEPLELYLRLKEDFGVQMTEDNESKLQAILLATATDAFFDDPEAFRGICETLCNGDPGMPGMDDLTLPEVLWGLYEVELNRDGEEFAPAVQEVINRELAQTAQDPDTGRDPDTDLYEFLQERLDSLRRQFQTLGIQDPGLPSIQPAGVQ